MLLSVLLGCFVIISAEKASQCTDCIKVGPLCHKVTYLFDLTAKFRNRVVIPKISILHSSNILYYVYEPEITDPEYSKIAFVNLDNNNITGEVAKTEVSKNFKVFDIDQVNNIIFVGSPDGIFNLDADSKPVFFSSRGDDIRSLFYKGNLFFVTESNRTIIEKTGNMFKTYDYQKVKNFVIDNENNLILLTNEGLFAVKLSKNVTVQLSKNPFIRGLTIDLQGTVYAWWIDIVYKVVIDKDFEDSRLEVVTQLEGLGAMTFDNANNILFNSNQGLFRLSPTNWTKC